MDKKGMTLLELLVVMAILVVVVTGALTFLSSLTKRSSQEAARSKTSQTGLISDLILIRDIAMAGMGVPVEVGGQFVPIGGVLPGGANPNNTGQNGSDQLMIKGAVISSGANDYFKWGYNTNYIISGSSNIIVSALPDPLNPTLPPYSPDVQDLFTLSRAGYRHPFQNGDMVVFLDAETKQLLGSNVYKVSSVGATGFNIAPNTDFTIRDYGSLIFSLGGINVPGNLFNNYVLNTFTGYRLSARYRLKPRRARPPQCDLDTHSLLRVYGGASDPILDCVLDFQVQFGLIDATTGNVTWLNDISATSAAVLRDQLKIVRIFIVKQMGKRDPKYFYPFSTIPNAAIPLFSVNSNGNVVNARPDAGPPANAIINLTNAQRQYHWRLITLDIPLRELQ